MTKHEKAVLAASKARMKSFMTNFGFSDYDAVLRSQRGLKTPQARLIRAVAQWLKATA